MKPIRRAFHIKYWPSRVIQVMMIFGLANLLFPLPTLKPYSTVIYARDGSLLGAYLSPDDKWRLRTTPGDVSEELITALIQKEDKWFYFHPGVNFLAIGRAFIQNISTGERRSGASTITMQVARLLEPKSRTYWSKVKEVFRAFQLEFHYSKDEILELYLSYLPYGGNIEGVQAASFLYFNKSPDQLSLSQSILMTIVPNRPNSLRLDREKEEALKVRDEWLDRFEGTETFPRHIIDQARLEPLFAERRSPGIRAPHLCRWLKSEEDHDIIHSTILPEKQEVCRQLLYNYVQRVKGRGVSNGAAIVIDNRDASVVAYCGSADFNDALASGQVDGTRAIRSPGSTLKPAAYGLAFDKGIQVPATVLNDIPINFGGYAPENYDLEYRGAVSVREALQHSLNTTAVTTLHAVGFQDFLQLMDRAGFQTIADQRDQLGLSTILGGCGVSLQELAGFYAAVAHGGIKRPLSFTERGIKQRSDSLSIFSPEASWMLADILSGLKRPDIPNDFLESAYKSRVAWKTGTSFGKRDAWAVGFNPRYTIAVWMGNFDGTGSTELSGAVMAVPLLFDLFDGLDRGGSWYPMPEGIFKRATCVESGKSPSANCTRIIQDYAIKNVSSQSVCALDKSILIAQDSSIQFCTECVPGSAYKTAIYKSWDPALVLWMEDNGISWDRPPPHNPECNAVLKGEGPKIVSPSEDFEYFIMQTEDQEILLQAASDEKASLHHWFVNGQYYQAALPGERIFFKPIPGSNAIVCMDDKGRETRMNIEVQVF